MQATFFASCHRECGQRGSAKRINIEVPAFDDFSPVLQIPSSLYPLILWIWVSIDILISSKPQSLDSKQFIQAIPLKVSETDAFSSLLSTSSPLLSHHFFLRSLYPFRPRNIRGQDEHCSRLPRGPCTSARCFSLSPVFFFSFFNSILTKPRDPRAIRSRRIPLPTRASNTQRHL